MLGFLITWEAIEPGVTLADWQTAAEITGFPPELWPEQATPEQVVTAAIQRARALDGKYTITSERHAGALVWRVTGGRRKSTAILFRRATEDTLIQWEKHPFAQAFAAAQAELAGLVPRQALTAMLSSLLQRYRAFQLEGALWYVPTSDPSEPIWEALRGTVSRLNGCRLGVYPVEDSMSGRASLAEGVAARVQAELDRPSKNSRQRVGVLAELAAGVDTVAQALQVDLSPLGEQVVLVMQEMRAALRMPVAQERWTFGPRDEVPAAVQRQPAPPPAAIRRPPPPPSEVVEFAEDESEDPPYNPRKRRVATDEDPTTLSERALRKLAKRHGIVTAGLTREQILSELGA